MQDFTLSEIEDALLHGFKRLRATTPESCISGLDLLEKAKKILEKLMREKFQVMMSLPTSIRAGSIAGLQIHDFLTNTQFKQL